MRLFLRRIPPETKAAAVVLGVALLQVGLLATLGLRTTSERETIPTSCPASTTGKPLTRRSRKVRSSSGIVISGPTLCTSVCMSSRVFQLNGSLLVRHRRSGPGGEARPGT